MQTAKLPFSMTLVPNMYGGDQVRGAGRLAHARPAQSSAIRPGQAGPVARLHQVDAGPEPHLGSGRPRAGLAAVRDSQEYKKLTPQSNYAAAADAAVYDPAGWYSGSGSNFETVMGSSIGAVEAGQLSADAAIAQHSGLPSWPRRRPPSDRAG